MTGAIRIKNYLAAMINQQTGKEAVSG